MGWTSSGSIQLSRDWQYTEPIAEGSYFRLKHTEAPNGGLFAIAQCEVDSEGKLSIGDSQILAVEKGIADVVKLPKTAYTDRRIAIKKISSQPNLEQEIRRLILPNLLAPIEQEINYIRRNNWRVDIEVSDYAEVVGIDYSDRFTTINTQLAAIEEKIEEINTSNGGASPSPLSDPYFSSIVLLAHFDSNFSDVKGRTIAPLGNAQISTTQGKFGAGSAYFDGSGDYLTLANSDDFHFGTDNFTIECWIKLEVNESRDRTIIAKVSPNQCAFLLNINSSNKVSFSSENFAGIISNSALDINTWYHIAVCRSSGNATIYINGVQQAFGNFPSSTQYSNPVYVGAFDPTNASYSFWFKGWIDELRITKGIARYTANFTPPTQPFPNN